MSVWMYAPGGGEAATTVTSAAEGPPLETGPATAEGETVSGSSERKEYF